MRGGAARPARRRRPAGAARAPSQAAKAAASWYAEAFTAMARVGAAEAADRTRACMPGMTENPTAPSTNTITAVITMLALTAHMRTSAAASAPSSPSCDRIGARSASRPPAKLPAAAPTPYTSSRTATAAAGKPVTSVTRGAKKVNTINSPALPTAVTAMASCTSRARNTRSSATADVPATSSRTSGTTRHTSRNPAAQHAATARNVARQPWSAPMNVPMGAPRIIDRFIPKTSLETVEACLPGGAVDTAMTIAFAKNVDVTSDVTIRAAKSTPYAGASAEARLPATVIPSMTRMSGLRGKRAVSAVSTGPPTIIPMAYAVTSSPAAGMETARSAAMSGRIPAMTNSPVVIPKTHTIRDGTVGLISLSSPSLQISTK
ncbi:hypothetical protein [Nonomuraea sp. B19D2]|uniref:hypothetical protein n=1 Tax=Nonomuraea sp. B19D2 TaxID=3159561 RepID=UPI0032DA6E5C